MLQIKIRQTALMAMCLLLGQGQTECSPQSADSLYQVALAQPDSMSVGDRIKAFERVLRADRKYAPAYHDIARLYISRRTPEARLEAKRAIDQAIRLDPKNVDYQLTLGELLWAQEFRTKAFEHYGKVLRKYPMSARAAYWMGRHAFDEFMDYKDRRRFESAGTDNQMRRPTMGDRSVELLPTDKLVPPGGKVIVWREFSEADRKLMFALLEKSLQVDPGFRDAYYKLGLAYLETEEPGGLLRTMKRLLRRVPDDKDGLLFCALGYLNLGIWSQASRYFSEALSQMEPEERALMESVDVLTQDDEQLRLARAAAACEDSASGVWKDVPELRRFWTQQDPLFSTAFNERRMEHYGRVAYANLRFGKPWEGIEGWRTDKGKTYTKFGRYRFRTTGFEGYYAGKETWYYEGFRISFLGDVFDWTVGLVPIAGSGLNKNGEPVRHQGPQWISVPAEAPSYVMRRTTPRYIDPFLEKKYSLPCLVVAFKEEDRVRVELAYAIPKDRLGISGSGRIAFSEGVFLFDEKWEDVYRKPVMVQRDVPEHARAEAAADSLRRDYLTSTRTLHVKPGAYHLGVEVVDKLSQSIGTFREQRAFAYPDTALAMSHLLLAGRIETLNPFPEKRGDLKIGPNPLRTYGRGDPVFIYLEVYNLVRDTFGRTQYDISYRIGRPERDEIDPALFASMDLAKMQGRAKVEAVVEETGFEEEGTTPAVTYRVVYKPWKRNRISERLKAGGQTDGGETAITARYEGDREDDFTYLQIDVAQVPVGVHKLTVSVRDVRTEQTAERDILFRVIE